MLNPYYKSLPLVIDKLKADNKKLLNVLSELLTELQSPTPNIFYIKERISSELNNCSDYKEQNKI